MNKIVEKLEELHLVEKRPVLKVTAPDIREFVREPEADAIGVEMAEMILRAEMNVDRIPEGQASPAQYGPQGDYRLGA